MTGRPAALAGSLLFLLMGPGTIAGLFPWLISHWQSAEDLQLGAASTILGLLLIVAGLVGLLESFVRFAWQGRGTPAPITPTDRLIFTGLYRHVRNPMYVCVLSLIVGQAMLLSRFDLILYAATVWLGFHLFVLLYEEPKLRRQFPDDYPDYACAVRRWLPRFKPWTPA